MNHIKNSYANQINQDRQPHAYPSEPWANGVSGAIDMLQPGGATAERPTVDLPPLLELPYWQKPPVARVMVTPTLARQWLESNHGNRFVKPQLVRHYAQQMKNGRWRLNGECIKFATDGHIVDGQHRLNAVVQSGVTVEMEVRVGLARDAALTVDTGATRNASDIMSMRGLTHWEADALGAAIKLLINHERGGTMWAAWRGDNQAIDDYFEAHQPLYTSLHTIRSACNQRNRLYPISLAIAMHCLFAQRDAHAADDFFHRLYRGVDIRSDEALHWLRRYCENVRDVQGRKRSIHDLAVRTVRAWNLTCEGACVSSPAKLSPRPGDFDLREML